MALTQADVDTMEASAGVPCAWIKSKRTIEVPAKDGEPAKRVPSWEIVVKRPTRVAYKLFRGKLNQPATVADAQEGLLRMSCLYPPPGDAFDALLDRAPAIPEAITPMLLKLLEGEAEEIEKPLGRSLRSKRSVRRCWPRGSPPCSTVTRKRARQKRPRWSLRRF